MSQKIDISIISSGANLADARLHRLTAALLRSGLRVEIFAPGKAADAPRALDSANALFIRKPWFATNWRRTNLIARYYRSRLFVLRSKGRVLYAISPEAIAPAYGHTRILRRKFAVDLYEDYLQLLKDRAWATKYFGLVGMIAKSDTRSALWFAKRADLTTVADIQVPPMTAKNRLVVRNLPDTSMLTSSGERDQTPRAIYIGDLRKSRGLHAMLRIAELAPDWEFDFVGNVAAIDQPYVDQWLIEHDMPVLADQSAFREVNLPSEPMRPRVRFHGRLAPADSWKYAAGAWVGLSLLESTPAFIDAVPSKLYEYMSIGLASITSPLPRCVELIAASQSGAVAQSPEIAAEYLNNWAKNPEQIDEIRNSASRWAAGHLDSEREYANFAAEMVKLTR